MFELWAAQIKLASTGTHLDVALEVLATLLGAADVERFTGGQVHGSNLANRTQLVCPFCPTTGESHIVCLFALTSGELKTVCLSVLF